MAYDISRRLSPPELQEAARVFGPHRQCLQWSFCFLQLIEEHPTKLSRQTLTAVDLHFIRRSTELLKQLGDHKQKTLRPARDSHLTSVLPDWRRLVQNLFTLYDSDRYGEHRGHQEPDPYEPWTDRRPAGQGEEYGEEKNEGANLSSAVEIAAATPAAVEIVNEKSAPSEPGPELHSGDAQSVTPAAVESDAAIATLNTAHVNTAVRGDVSEDAEKFFSGPAETINAANAVANTAETVDAANAAAANAATVDAANAAAANAATVDAAHAAVNAAVRTEDPDGFIAEIFKPPDAPIIVTTETAETTVAFFNRPTMNTGVIRKRARPQPTLPLVAIIEQAERVIGGKRSPACVSITHRERNEGIGHWKQLFQLPD